MLSESRLQKSDDRPRRRWINAVVVVLWTIGHVLAFLSIAAIVEWEALMDALMLALGKDH